MSLERRQFLAAAAGMLAAGRLSAAGPNAATDDDRVDARIDLLFLDPRWIESRHDLKTVIAPCRMHPQNPLAIDGRTPWTRNNLHLIVDREPDGTFSGWYEKNLSDDPMDDSRSKFRIVSDDGLHWRTTGETFPLPCAASVIEDTADPDPSRRWKAVFQGWAELAPNGALKRAVDKTVWLAEGGKENTTLVRGIFAAHSADRREWNGTHAIVPESVAEGKKWWTPGEPGWAGGDNFPCLLYDAERGKYVTFYRTNIDQGDRGTRRERGIGRSESADFARWGDHELILHARSAWQGEMGHGRHDYYQLQAWPCGGAWLGLLSVYYWDEDRVRLELAWSPNTRDWERVCPGTDFVPHGKLGEPGGGCRYGGMRPQTVGDDAYVYFGGDEGRHNADKQRAGSMFVALFGRDRFAGLASCGDDAELLTATFDALSLPLQLNADARDGEIVAELCTADGAVLDGYSRAEFRPIRADQLSATLTWNGDPAPRTAIAGVRLRLLAQGKVVLYALKSA